MLANLLFVAAVAVAAPAATKRKSGPTDTQILNYALTLEHLENAFYMQGLQNFSQSDFTKLGAQPVFYRNLQEISHDETTHVQFLESALGSNAVAACNYAFPVTDAKSFLAVASVLEGVGVSAYLGAARYIMDKDYLTAAGSILTVEARHSAFLRAYNRQSPFPYPFDVPLDFDEAFSLASLFITSCPNGLDLPFKPFPTLSASPGAGKAGDKLMLTAGKSCAAKAAYFITSTGATPAPLTGSGTSYTVTIPSTAQPGQGYLVLTSNNKMPTDENIVAGPAVVSIDDYLNGGTNTA